MSAALGAPLRRLIDLQLDGKLDATVALWRAEQVSWRGIAAHLFNRTGVEVSHETLRSWYPNDRRADQ